MYIYVIYHMICIYIYVYVYVYLAMQVSLLEQQQYVE